MSGNESTGVPKRESKPVAFIVSGRRVAVTMLAFTAFLGGFAEAAFLVLVTRIAFTVTEGDSEVEILGQDFGVGTALGLAFALVVSRLVVGALSSWQSALITSGVVAGLRRRLAHAFLMADWETQQRQQSGSLQELLTTYSSQASSLVNGVATMVLSGANLLALTALALVVHPLGALVLFVSVALLGSLLRPLRAAVRRRAKASAAVGMEFATSLNEVSELGLELHVFQVQREAMARTVALIDRTAEQARRLQFANGLVAPLYSSLAFLALLAALSVAHASSADNLTSLGAAMLVMLRSLSYGQALQSSYTIIASNAAYVDGITSQLNEFERGRRHDGGESTGSIMELRAENVTFAYSVGQDVLRDVSFTVHTKEIVGIVGPSGGGKSTLVQLLLGLRDPQTGRIIADGRDIRTLSKAEWARKVTFVPQAAHLIAGSIADNIRFLREDVSDDDLQAAAALAHIHDDVLAFPEGYQRFVGERGGHLSGGQQQRLCIARALVEKPDVLILDEPTSALDVRSEHLIRSTLLGLKERMTVIVIAHRLSTLDICDRIMVIQGGEIKGFDTPERLEQSNDFYREALVLSGMR